MAIFTNLDSVMKNKYLKSLTEKCGGFGVYHSYIDYKNDVKPELSGIYSVYGFDKNIVNNPNLNIANVLKRDYNANIFTDVKAVKLTNAGAFATYINIINDCKDLELFKKLHETYKLPLPKKITNVHVDYIKMLYLNAINEKIPFKDRDVYYVALQRSSSAYVESIKKEKIEEKNKDNCMSIKDLVYTVGDIQTGYIESKYVDDFKKEMKVNYSSIPYYISKKPEIVREYDAPKGQGFDIFGGNTKDYVFAYPTRNNKEMNELMFKLHYRDIIDMGCEDIKNLGDLSYTAIPLSELSNFTNYCKVSDIPFSINENNVFFLNTDDVCVSFLKKDSESVNKIIEAISLDSTDNHLFVGFEKTTKQQEWDDYRENRFIEIDEKTFNNLINKNTSLKDVKNKNNNDIDR